MSLNPPSLRAAAASALGIEVITASRIGGGSLSEVLQLTLADETSVIVKGGTDPNAEADMLAAMRGAGVPVPGVVAVDDFCLVLQLLPNDGSIETAWGNLGEVLAALHRTTGQYYGWRSDYAFGDISIPNATSTNWPAFWAMQRLLPHLSQIDSGIASRVSALAQNIDRFLPAAPPAALLHGDCWGGNILVSNSKVSGLIDPACYYGHNEVDIAMLALFDNPGEAFFSAYGKPEPGYRERIAIYSLWPALVHLRLFGEGYAPMVHSFLRTTGH